MIYLAYDGSINSDWVSRYAIRMAMHSHENKLILLHVLDGRLQEELISERINAVQNECNRQNIQFEAKILQKRKSVFHSLISQIPHSPDSLCLSGTRVRSHRKGYLAGTVSEKLLRSGLFHVLTVRVVQPGLLGNPGEFLFPVSGHPRGFQAGIPFVRLLLPEIEILHVLRVMKVPSLLYQHLSPVRARALTQKGLHYVSEIIKEIKTEASSINDTIHMDSSVTISNDWAGEILIQASKLRVRMILMGTSERRLPGRYFYGNTLEHMLRKTPCDIGIYRGI